MISNQRTSDSERLSLASDILLAPAQLGTDQLQSLLGGKLAGRADYADVYFQHSRHEAWILEDGLVRDASFNLERGAGVRLVSGDKPGFAYSDDISLDALTQAGSAAAAIGRQGKDQSVRIGAAKTMPARYPALDPLPGWSSEMKVALLQEMDRLARSLDPAVKEVTVSLSGEQDVVLVAATDGTLAADVRPLIRFNISVIAERGGRRERGSAGGGGRVAYDWLRQDGRLETWTRDAVRQALLNLDAEPAPAGTMPVVLGPGWPGVLLHEAVGHGLEGDFNRKGSSLYSGRLGQPVAAKGVTIVDDGTLSDRRGSLTIDDEGTPTQRTTLIENGVLTGYMQDTHNARLMGVAPTGNGRRESYAHLPMPRMTNTYMLAGEHDPAEIIASVDRGLFAVNFEGGQVDITSGNFTFATSEAYLIEGGKVTRPVKGATLIGNGPAVMNGVSMVGNDLALDRGTGVCGKDGQSVPVGVGQPTLKLDKITVGGTA